MAALAGIAAAICALPAGAASSPSSGNDTCGYAASSFTESTVMRWAQINGTGTSAQFIAYANDEKGLLLGVNGATPMPSVSNGSAAHVSGASGGDITATDPSGRPYFPALYITNLTAHASSNGTGAGDFQNGGTPRNISSGQAFIDDVFGSWSTATVSSGSYKVTPPTSKNDWNLGAGSDAPVGTTFANMGDEGYGSEVRWNVSGLRDSDGNLLTPGNTYRFQVIEHDGDQNKTGGDAGEFCANLSIPGNPPAITTTASSSTTGNPIHDTATLTGSSGSGGKITWNVYNSSDTGCKSSLATVTDSSVNADGTYVSPDWTAPAAGQYEWVATYSSSTGSISTACNDPNEVSTVSTTPTPAIQIVKLERDGASGSYLPGPINVKVGDTIDYQITITNKGNTTLALKFGDPHCDAGTLSAPSVVSGTYDASSSTLSAGGAVQYTCSHIETASDPAQFVNTATVTGTPPSGTPVSGTSSVAANKQSVSPAHVKRCPAGKHKKVKRVHGKKVVACVAKKIVSKPPKRISGFTG